MPKSLLVCRIAKHRRHSLKHHLKTSDLARSLGPTFPSSSLQKPPTKMKRWRMEERDEKEERNGGTMRNVEMKSRVFKDDYTESTARRMIIRSADRSSDWGLFENVSSRGRRWIQVGDWSSRSEADQRCSRQASREGVAVDVQEAERQGQAGHGVYSFRCMLGFLQFGCNEAHCEDIEARSIESDNS
ncbi:hypothetical protein Scep_009173 [Stephania cephalantha]|uniref:Uncharacterized protein n=1 Tax=Stephania cephalantha TaxID=152367 RepID=A0AAP0PCV9_9MAGN